MIALAITDSLLISHLKDLAFLTLTKWALLIMFNLAGACSEVLLFCISWSGPVLILVFILAMNAYLTVKPLVHTILAPGKSFRAAFIQGKREVARMFQWHARLFHMHEIKGFHRIPNTGGALIVYYHGSIPLDYMYLMAKVYLEKQRLVLSIVDRYMIWTPGFETLSAGFGSFAGTREDCVCKLRAGQLLGVAPGGGIEAQCSSAQTYEMLWKRRIGFAKVAMEARVPIIPDFKSPLAPDERTRLP